MILLELKYTVVNMKCTIPSQNVKIIARAIHSLSKIGDEMFIEPMPEEITFRTVNMAQSAFAEFKMNQNFFSFFSFTDPEDCNTLCKVTMRSCINVFKNMHNLDKQVENCEIRIKPEATVVIFQIKFTNAPVKKYYLPVIETEKLEAAAPTDTLNRITASSKMLMSTIKNFRYSEDEITVTVEKDKTLIKNHIEFKKDVHLMRTELCFHPTEFETYHVSNPTCITFCFKELRAILSFAEPSNLSVCMSFSNAGMPILFQVLNLPAYEAKYVVSTLNANANATNLSTTLTKSSRNSNDRPSASINISQVNQKEIYNVINETEQYSIQQDSVIAEESLQLQSDISKIDNRRTRTNKQEPVINLISDQSISSGRGTNNCKKRKISESDNTISARNSVESVYSTFDKKTFPLITALNTSSDQSSSEKLELIKIVFSRCFKKCNVLEKIPGNEIIVSETSDAESI